MRRFKPMMGMILGGIVLIATAAYAQWQGCNHCVPIGKGPGVTGFTFLTPSATVGVPVVSQGSGVDPAFGVVSVPGGGSGVATFTANGVLVGNGTGAIISNRCTMDSNQSLVCTSATTFRPEHILQNTMNDTTNAFMSLRKNRAGGNSLSGDSLGTFQMQGFANGAVQNTAALTAQQTGASVGSNIPSQILIRGSTTAGQLDTLWAFDAQNKNLVLPTGGLISFQGSSSGSAVVASQAAAGNPVLTLPNTTGTFAISAGATAPLSVNTTTGALGFTGMSTNGVLVATSATTVVTDRCSMNGDQSINCTSATTFSPFFQLQNTTNDTGSAQFIVAKTRSGGNTLSGDLLGQYIFRGFANSGVRDAARIDVTQTAASSGSNIPTSFTLNLSTTAGLNNTPWTWDGAGKANTLPPGGSIVLPGATSGSSTVSTAAVAGTSTFTLPVGNGTNGFVLSTNGSGVTSWVAAAAGAIDVQVFTTTGANTWTRPGGVTVTQVIVCGAGGGGGGGGRVAANTAGSGGGGGGGGYCNQATYKATDAGASQTVTVATGGTGGAGATVNGNNGTDGGSGGNTTFGSLLTGFGGGGGQGGRASTAGAGGGGGGGPSQAGTVGVNGVPTIGLQWNSELAPIQVATVSTTVYPCAGVYGALAQLVTATDMNTTRIGCPNGGGGGGASVAAASPSGGWTGQDAGFHGPGGGGGGGINNTNNFNNSADGGKSIGCPTAAGRGNTANGGSTAADFNYHPGCGGGGAAGSGVFNGGAGTSGGGGGGGVVGSNANAGAGGAGGNGFAIVVSW